MIDLQLMTQTTAGMPKLRYTCCSEGVHNTAPAAQCFFLHACHGGLLSPASESIFANSSVTQNRVVTLSLMTVKQHLHICGVTVHM